MSSERGPAPTDRAFDELTPREAYGLWRLRQQVFVVEQNSPYPDLDGRDLEPTTRHLTISDAEEIVACLRLLDDGAHLRIGRVAVARSHRRRGLSRVLMQAAMARIEDRPCRLDAQTQLGGFYASYGFTIDGPAFVEDGVAHLPMSR